MMKTGRRARIIGLIAVLMLTLFHVAYINLFYSGTTTKRQKEISSLEQNRQLALDGSVQLNQNLAQYAMEKFKHILEPDTKNEKPQADKTSDTHKVQILPPVLAPSIAPGANLADSMNKSNIAKRTQTHQNLFIGYNLSSPRTFHVKEDKREYVRKIGNLTCMVEGTDLLRTSPTQSAACQCLEGWFGPWCSFPEILKQSSLPLKSLLTLRSQPRRLIVGMPYNIEKDMTETRFHDHVDVVDLFMICESNYTGYGDKKPLRLLKLLEEGFLLEYHNKISYVYLDYFPKEAHKNGWIADALVRDHIGVVGLKYVKGLRHDDLFLLHDTDEIPTRDTLLFLKLHNGFPEPFGWNLFHTTYGYFWQGGDGTTSIMGGATVGFVVHVFRNKVYKLRNPTGNLPKLGAEVSAYVKGGGDINMWKFGSTRNHAGWHCCWCFPPEMMRVKLVSAINADFPRWGDYPEKRDLDYIKGLIKKGMWFDGKDNIMEKVSPHKAMYAPKYILNNKVRFKHLLENPYQDNLLPLLIE